MVVSGLPSREMGSTTSSLCFLERHDRRSWLVRALRREPREKLLGEIQKYARKNNTLFPIQKGHDKERCRRLQ